VEIALAVFLVTITVGLFAVWRSQAREPEVWRRRLHERRWTRALAWTASLTAAGALGALLGGAADLSVAIATLGGLVALLFFVLWSYARTFGPNDRSG
jgi:hypothetical protein